MRLAALALVDAAIRNLDGYTDERGLHVTPDLHMPTIRAALNAARKMIQGAPEGAVASQGAPAQPVKPRPAANARHRTGNARPVNHATSTSEDGNPPIPACESAGTEASGELGMSGPPKAGGGSGVDGT